MLRKRPVSNEHIARDQSNAVSLDDLPPMNTERWVIRRKAEVVQGVRAGLLTAEEACKRYNLSSDEFASWESLIDRHGVPGLRTTRIQQYRDKSVADRP